MPQIGVHQPVDVVEELAPQPGLADAGRAGDRDQPRSAPLDGAVEQLLEQAQVAVAPDERRLEHLLALASTDPSDHPRRPPQPQRLGLALDRVLAGVLVGDRGRGHVPRDFVDEHRPRVGGRLHARCRVDPVADDQSFAGILERRHLPGGDPGSRPQPHGAELVAEHRDRVDDLERCPDGAFGVVLACDRRAPDRHHGVADELLDHAPVAVDDRSRRFEVVAEQLADVFGFARLRQRREPDQIDEQDRHQTQLRRQLGDRRRFRRDDRCRRQRSAALVAKSLAGFVRRAARGAP